MNRTKILFNEKDKEIVIPIEMTWDFYGQQDSVNEYEQTVIEEILNSDQDFEITRFEHNQYSDDVSPSIKRTDINYEFYFYNPSVIINPTFKLPGQWQNSYLPKFQVNEINFVGSPNLPNNTLTYNPLSFKKSFWKLDLYDYVNPLIQKNYITIILPTHQGLTQITSTGFNNQIPVEIKKPKYLLDYLGDKEGFFIYWLKKRDYLNIDTFFMSAKFFDAKKGQFIRMTNRAQNSLSNNVNPFILNGDDYFYYKVLLNYTNQKYEVWNYNQTEKFGTNIKPIVWYEYVNP